MRRHLIVSFLVLITPAVIAALTPAVAADIAAGTDPALTDPALVPFPVGEELTHKIYWGIIPVGKAVTATEWIEEDGRKLISIKLRTRTNTLFDRIRPVNDVIESIVDPVTLLPLRYCRTMIRRKAVHNEITVFDYEILKATWVADSPPPGKTNIFDIAADTRDILSFMYYSRGTDVEENTNYEFRVMADDGMFDLKVSTGRNETITLPFYGKVTGLVLTPQFDFDGVLVAKGNFRIWVSDDPRRVLTRAEIKNTFVNMNIVLQTVKGPGSDMWIAPEDGRINQ